MRNADDVIVIILFAVIFGLGAASLSIFIDYKLIDTEPSPETYVRDTYLPRHRQELNQGLVAFLVNSEQLTDVATEEEVEEWVDDNVEWMPGPYSLGRRDIYAGRYVASMPINAKGSGDLPTGETLLVDLRSYVFLEVVPTRPSRIFFIWDTGEYAALHVDDREDPVLKVEVGDEAYVSLINWNDPNKDRIVAEFIESARNDK